MELKSRHVLFFSRAIAPFSAGEFRRQPALSDIPGLWVLPFNSKAKSCCLCSEICFGTFFSAISMAELLESGSARMLFRFSDFCFSSFLEIQFFDPLCLLRFPLSRDFFPQSRTFLFLFFFFHCPLRNHGILF